MSKSVKNILTQYKNSGISIYDKPATTLWSEICTRPVFDHTTLNLAVGKIIKEVKDKGDIALRKFAQKFDGVTIDQFLVSDAELKLATKNISPSLKAAIQQAKRNIEFFHRTQKEEVREINISKGITC